MNFGTWTQRRWGAHPSTFMFLFRRQERSASTWVFLFCSRSYSFAQVPNYDLCAGTQCRCATCSSLPENCQWSKAGHSNFYFFILRTSKLTSLDNFTELNLGIDKCCLKIIAKTKYYEVIRKLQFVCTKIEKFLKFQSFVCMVTHDIMAIQH